MKTLRLESSPTRHHRLNEILGVFVLVAAALLLLALASYTPSDPSFNTAGGYPGQLHPAHNYTGLIGAFLSDALLQTLGVATFLFPLLLIRLGICWVRSRACGSALAKFAGLALWIVFAPAGVALLPTHVLFRSALPLPGIAGRFVADAMVHLLNLPGASIVVALMVALSLYLASTFALNTAREWLTHHFAFVGVVREKSASLFGRRRAKLIPAEMIDEQGEVYGARREKADAEARALALKQQQQAEKEAARAARAENSLLSGMLGWFHSLRYFGRQDKLNIIPEDDASESAPASLWQGMPRTDVDAPAVTALSTAAAAAAPFAQALAAAAAPLPLQPDELPYSPQHTTPAQSSFIDATDDDEPFSFVTRADSQSTAKPASQPAPRPQLVTRAAPEPAPLPARVPTTTPEPIRAPQPQAYAPQPPAPAAFVPAPIPAAEPASDISFGRRADSDLKAVAITAKSVRGYKLPSSSLLYQSNEQAVVREEACARKPRSSPKNAPSLAWMARWFRSTPAPSSPRSSSAPKPGSRSRASPVWPTTCASPWRPNRSSSSAWPARTR